MSEQTLRDFRWAVWSACRSLSSALGRLNHNEMSRGDGSAVLILAVIFAALALVGRLLKAMCGSYLAQRWGLHPVEVQAAQPYNPTQPLNSALSSGKRSGLSLGLKEAHREAACHVSPIPDIGGFAILMSYQPAPRPWYLG